MSGENGNGTPQAVRRPVPWWKRAADVTVSAVGLVVLSPLLLAIAVGVKLSSPGPVLFKQVRAGFDGRHFIMWKFRSLRAGAEQSPHQDLVKKLIRQEAGEALPWREFDVDPRVTRIGRLLRKSSLDELPQFVNILRGDMSLIGPRPPVPYEVAEYLPWHHERLKARPGMTGLWQIIGRNTGTFDEMVRTDIRYINEMSPLLDFKIFFGTLPAALRHFRTRNEKIEG